MPERRPRPAAGVVLAFDFGRRRIGVAAGDTVSGGSSPLAALAVPGETPPWPAIEALLREWRPEIVVVGLPYNADGSESPLARAARAFAATLGDRFSVRVELVDERYSSLEAGMRLREARATGRRRRRVAKGDVDAAAACVILERWFESRAGMPE
ncbi:MAG: Holliday junction resolvase RuvX [Gammaproteobacteria bacterium]|nr:Holliday junction resolvase RuvX [Gammaproteobacteria bacterium]